MSCIKKTKVVEYLSGARKLYMRNFTSEEKVVLIHYSTAIVKRVYMVDREIFVLEGMRDPVPRTNLSRPKATDDK